MVYYFGLVVNEDANPIGCKSGEDGQFGYKVGMRNAPAARRD